MDFCKCQGCPLLTALSASARSTLRHFEVASCLQPLEHAHADNSTSSGKAKSFLFVAVTDWSLLLVSLPSARQPPQLLLELPLVNLAHVEVEAGLDAAAELQLNDARRGIHSERISVWLLPDPPRQAPWQQQQQQQGPRSPGNMQQQHMADAMLAALKQQLAQDGRPAAAQQACAASDGAAQSKTGAPWQQQPAARAAHHGWQLRSVPEAACDESGAGSSGESGVRVQHIACSSSSTAAGGRMQDTDRHRVLRLLTVERSSRLGFHLQRAWMGAHMRAALAAAGAPGLRSWAPPGRAPAAAPTATAAGGAAVLGLAQRRQSQVDILILPSPRQHSMAACGQCHHPLPLARSETQPSPPCYHHSYRQQQDGGLCADGGPLCHTSSSSSRPQTAPAHVACAARRGQLQAGSVGQLSSRPPRPSMLQKWAPAWRAAAAMVAAAGGTSRPLSRESGDVSGLATRAGSSSSSSFSMAWRAGGLLRAGQHAAPLRSLSPSTDEGASSSAIRPFSRGQQRVLRDTLQEGAELLTEPAASAAQQLLWEIADKLRRPCSLFDAGDCVVLQRLVLELASARQEQAAALLAAFFSSDKMLAFILARLTSWCSLMSLFADGLPPIQNPAQPGSIAAWTGRPVVWTTHLTYPGRPQQLMKALGLTQRSRICFRAALKASAMIAQRHQQAAASWAAARAAASSSSSSSAGGMPQAYHADPLHLSPLPAASYPFVAAAQRMLAGGHGRLSSSGGGTGSIGSSAAAAGSGAGYDLSSQGTLAEATSVLRWERLAGRLAARIARRKVALLLQALQLHLAFSEGCHARALWLSHKGLRDAAPAADAVQPEPWTCRDATQQVIALLLTMHIPGVRANLAAASAAAAAGGVGASAAQSTSSAAGRKPQGTQDFLWWAACCDRPGGDSGRSGLLLDSIVGVLFELSGLAQDQDRLHNEAAAGAVIEVVRTVPESCLQPLLRALALRFVGLMTGTAGGSRSCGEAAVLAHRYGSVLLEVLGGVAGCAAELAAAIGVEVQHLMAVPAVRAQLAAAAAACGDSVLARANSRLLACVLAAVRAAPASLADQQACTIEGLRLPEARACGGGSIMKVQN